MQRIRPGRGNQGPKVEGLPRIDQKRSVAAEPQEKYNSRKWKLWQFTTTGRVPGIKGAVDRNAYAGSRQDWTRFLAQNGVISRQVASAEEVLAATTEDEQQ